ncbi:MAG: DUF2652 domain-containing protein [Chitinophagaceae bacterium]|nr:DUF2652 domain-containing protein [Chitinophagaceae bacterium]
MDNRGLLFIPDISGFTQFVNATEIEHSRLIIQELLEQLINSNEIGLEVSEIEGDAILFYRFGDSPPLEELYRQVAKMFCEFHRKLIAYEHRKFCHCAACVSAIDLTLKVITHYGEFTGYNVKTFNKLIGKDIIVAHQLLKNDIDQHEYWLITQSALNDSRPTDLTSWMEWNRSAKQTENGVVAFHYTQLGELRKEVLNDPMPPLDLSGKTKALSVSRDYDADIITVFHATGDFRYRARWLDGIKSVEEVDHLLPRVGMRCKCVFENGSETIYSSSYSYGTQRIEFTETDDNRHGTRHFILEKMGERSTRLTIDIYKRDTALARLLKRMRNKQTAASWHRSLTNLDAVVREISKR